MEYIHLITRSNLVVFVFFKNCRRNQFYLKLVTFVWIYKIVTEKNSPCTVYFLFWTQKKAPLAFSKNFKERGHHFSRALFTESSLLCPAVLARDLCMNRKIHGCGWPLWLVWSSLEWGIDPLRLHDSLLWWTRARQLWGWVASGKYFFSVWGRHLSGLISGIAFNGRTDHLFCRRSQMWIGSSRLCETLGQIRSGIDIFSVLGFS